MNRGDVVRVRLPPPPQGGGHEQAGNRPAVVVQCDDNSPGTAIVVPLTSRQQHLRFPGAVQIKQTDENGLSTDSVALVHQVRAIDRKRIGEQLGHLSQEDLSRIKDSLRKLLDL